MNIKNFLLAGIAGGIADFIMGFLMYGILFNDYFGGAEPNLTLIFCGCMSFGFLIAYIYTRWANLTTFTKGLQAGAGIGVLMGLMHNFFTWSIEAQVDYQKFMVDVAIGLVMGTVVGGVVAAVNGALNKPSTTAAA